MSRFRLSFVLAAAAGILITTGGCAESATAPDARAADLSEDRRSQPAFADSTSTAATDDEATVSGGVLLNGGGRS